jgi:hypothetical protein
MSKFAIVFFGLFASSIAFANCDINLEIENTGERTFEIHNQWESQVKIKGGMWHALRTTSWFTDTAYFTVAPNQVEGDVLEAVFNCGANRRYKITYTCKQGSFAGRTFVKYFPSADGWTTNQNVSIKIGNCDN